MKNKYIIFALASENRVLESLRNSAYWGDVEACKAIATCKERIEKLRKMLWNNERTESEIVEETMNHIIGGYYTANDPEGYADSGENPLEVFKRQVCKNCYAIRRDRKIADNRKHYTKICAKRGEIV